MKLFKQLSIIFIATMLLSSCKFIKEHTKLFGNDSDTLLDVEQPVAIVDETISNDTTEIETIVQETEPIAEATEPQSPQFGYGDNKFYMVVGSFLTEGYAQKYAEKMVTMGYQPQIIKSPYQGYFRVSARSYNNYELALNDISAFRDNVTPRAWVHIKKK